MRVSFEAALKDAAALGDDAVRQITPSATQAVAGTPDAELRPDLEMSTASATALRYGALIALLNRQVQLDSLAMTGNQ
jgi:flagellar basal-body rod protein FlgB